MRASQQTHFVWKQIDFVTRQINRVGRTFHLASRQNHRVWRRIDCVHRQSVVVWEQFLKLADGFTAAQLFPFGRGKFWFSLPA
jgi:hypothetical protein